jgi:hypothetical protein
MLLVWKVRLPVSMNISASLLPNIPNLRLHFRGLTIAIALLAKPRLEM